MRVSFLETLMHIVFLTSVEMCEFSCIVPLYLMAAVNLFTDGWKGMADTPIV